MQVDAVFQMVGCYLLAVERFLGTFPDDVERPLLVVLRKEVEGVDEQVETLVTIGEAAYGKELLRCSCRRLARL